MTETTSTPTNDFVSTWDGVSPVQITDPSMCRFHVPIMKALNYIHPGHGISVEGVAVINDIIEFLFDKLITKLRSLPSRNMLAQDVEMEATYGECSIRAWRISGEKRISHNILDGLDTESSDVLVVWGTGFAWLPLLDVLSIPNLQALLETFKSKQPQTRKEKYVEWLVETRRKYRDQNFFPGCITSSDIVNAVRLILPTGGVLKQAIKEINKCADNEEELSFPKFLCCHQLASLIGCPTIRKAGAAAAAFLEYMASELLELAGNASKGYKCKSIEPRHFMLALKRDKELDSLLKESTFIVGAGKSPSIHKFALYRRRERIFEIKCGETKYQIHPNQFTKVENSSLDIGTSVQAFVEEKKISGKIAEEFKPLKTKDFAIWVTGEYASLRSLKQEGPSSADKDVLGGMNELFKSKLGPCFVRPENIRDPFDSPPQSLCCPITQALMADPVVAADGHTYSYERSAIERWFERSNTSPKTGLALPNTTLTPNHLSRGDIIE